MVGVPFKTPEVDNVIPDGKVLAVENVIGEVPPVDVNVWLNKVPCIPDELEGFVTLINGQELLIAKI